MEQQEVEEKLEEVLKLSKQNNKILRKVRTQMRWGLVLRIFYWIVIVGTALGIYVFLQPYLEGLAGTYETFGDFIDNPREFIERNIGQ